MRLSRPPRHGFTLVELAVVLAILGLLIGGVMAGKSLLKAQKLRKVGSDAMGYMIALNQFKQQYAYVPGDFPGASAIWGRADGGSPSTDNCSFGPAGSASGTGTATCNGDGNGAINGDQLYDTGSGSSFTNQGPNISQESLRAWQHLSAAQLISIPRMSGVTNMPDPSSKGEYPGLNIPVGPIEGSAFSWLADSGTFTGGLIINNAQSANYEYYDGDYNGALIFGGQYVPMYFGKQDWYEGPILTPSQMFELDTKLDDGLAGSGNVRSPKPTAGAVWQNCALSNTSSGYNISDPSVDCPVIFLSTFAAGKSTHQ